jgi:hypothetical protein
MWWLVLALVLALVYRVLMDGLDRWIVNSRQASYLKNPPFHVKRRFLTQNEQRLFVALNRALAGEGVYIFANVKLSDILELKRGLGNERRYFLNQINQKHVDFLICSTQDLRPIAAIELDDSSHLRADRQASDSFKNRVLPAAGLNLIRLSPAASYSEDQLRTTLGWAPRDLVQPATAAIPQPPAGTQTPDEADTGNPRCCICGCVVTPRVASYCLQHKDRFGGKIYCYEHQRNRAQAEG